MLGALRSRSAGARRGLGGARRLQAPTPRGVAALSVGVGSSASPADGLRRALRARVSPMAPCRRAGRREVPRLRSAQPRVCAHPLRRRCTPVLARVLVQVPLLHGSRVRRRCGRRTRDPLVACCWSMGGGPAFCGAAMHHGVALMQGVRCAQRRRHSPPWRPNSPSGNPSSNAANANAFRSCVGSTMISRPRARRRAGGGGRRVWNGALVTTVNRVARRPRRHVVPY
jgi:hypothetical protein